MCDVIVNCRDAANDLLSREGVDVNAALWGVARGNHGELVDRLLSLEGAEVNVALRGAAVRGHGALVNRCASHGGTHRAGKARIKPPH